MAGRKKKPRPPKTAQWGRVRSSYEQTVREMTQACINWKHDNKPLPRFALPHRDVVIFGSLDEHGHRVARDASARELVELFKKIGLDVGGATPTLLMLEAALVLGAMPIERVSLSELGVPTPTTV
jgi:hypothetical protein